MAHASTNMHTNTMAMPSAMLAAWLANAASLLTGRSWRRGTQAASAWPAFRLPGAEPNLLHMQHSSITP